MAIGVMISMTGNKMTPTIVRIRMNPDPASAEVTKNPYQSARPGCASASSRQFCTALGAIQMTSAAIRPEIRTPIRNPVAIHQNGTFTGIRSYLALASYALRGAIFTSVGRATEAGTVMLAESTV